MPSTLSPRSASMNQNPVLTRVVQGVKKQSDKFVGQFLFPKVPVATPTGSLLTFDNSNMVVYDTKRSPGEATKRRRLGFSGQPYKLTQDSIEGELPQEIIRDSQSYARLGQGGGVVPYNFEKHTAEGAMESIDLGLEAEIATLATTAGNYKSGNVITLSGTDQLDDPGSSIISVINQGRDLTNSGIADEANSAIIGRKVFDALIDHHEIRGYIAGATVEVVQEERLAQILRLKRGVRVARANTLADGTAADFESIWGNVIVMAYVPETITPSRLEPAFGYTYELENYPMAEDPYFERNTKTWYYPVTDERAPYIVNNGAGVLIQNAISA